MRFGDIIKNTRLKRHETLHKLSMGTNIDVTLLSKIERNVRFPTNAQVESISKYFNLSEVELKSLVVSSKIIKKYGVSDVTKKAVQLVSEEIASYIPNSEKRELWRKK